MDRKLVLNTLELGNRQCNPPGDTRQRTELDYMRDIGEKGYMYVQQIEGVQRIARAREASNVSDDCVRRYIVVLNLIVLQWIFLAMFQ